MSIDKRLEVMEAIKSSVSTRTYFNIDYLMKVLRVRPEDIEEDRIKQINKRLSKFKRILK